MYAVVFEEVRRSVDRAAVVDRDKLNIVAPAFDDGSGDETADPAKSTDGDTCGHGSFPQCSAEIRRFREQILTYPIGWVSPIGRN